MTFFIPFLTALTILSSCNGQASNAYVDLEQSSGKVDTAKPVIEGHSDSTIFPQYFNAAFQAGTRVNENKIKYDYYRTDIGKITIESGYIIACDPVSMDAASPFTQVFPKGTFPVQLAIARTKDDERVALSRILFSNEPVNKWEYALLKGQKPIQLKDSTFYCYGVDAGMGIFIDSISNHAFNLKDQEAWSNVFMDKLYQPGKNGFVHEFEGHNLACFSTGYGDGCYATFIGFDSKGNPCQLLTDFGLVRWWL